MKEPTNQEINIQKWKLVGAQTWLVTNHDSKIMSYLSMCWTWVSMVVSSMEITIHCSISIIKGLLKGIGVERLSIEDDRCVECWDKTFKSMTWRNNKGNSLIFILWF